MYDIIIIGAGVCGAAIARELSRYEAKICVLEKEEDVCCGTSKANSGIIHAGFDAENGTWKAKMNVQGNKMMPKMAEELDFPYQQLGSLVVCTDEKRRNGLEQLLERGRKNGVKGLRILEREELLGMEANISDGAVAALYAPTGGIVCPFEMNLAYAENACTNGVEFRFSTRVKEIRKREGSMKGTDSLLPAGYEVICETKDGEKEVFTTRFLINAAGVYADVIHNMVCKEKLCITPRRGDYVLLDKTAGKHVSRTIFALPDGMGKGVLITPTVHGNVLVGPTAIEISDREGTNTTAEGLLQVAVKSQKTVKNLPMNQTITSFAGLRAHEKGGDFILGEASDAPGFVDCAGIESPGLSSAPAIGVWIADLMKERMHLREKEHFVSKRKGMVHPFSLSDEEHNELIQKNPAYGTIACRCEKISEGEILDAIHRPLGARSLDGIKRRTRAGMGRCQAGFCTPGTMELVSRELQVPMTELTKCGGNSKIVVGFTKEEAKRR
ncbi:MAG: NAD(P)/FAD-dependent oxidoreductase [Fusicatenibacter sp.]